MGKIKLTKTELKNQKETLKRFLRYLPLLQLKKKQLQLELGKVLSNIEQLKNKQTAEQERLDAWVGVFSEKIEIKQLLKLNQVVLETVNVCGIDLPYFKDAIFQKTSYDYFSTPLWLDQGLKSCQEKVKAQLALETLQKQQMILRQELRVTSQRLNLFEKVKIPQAKENIRKINIFLGDLRTAEVVRGKIAKAKISQQVL